MTEIYSTVQRMHVDGYWQMSVINFALKPRKANAIHRCYLSQTEECNRNLLITSTSISAPRTDQESEIFSFLTLL